MTEKQNFNVKLGDLVQLQFVPQNGRERLTAKVIGYSPNKSIIITAPRVNGKLPLLKAHQPFVVRMLQGNNVYGFESSVLKYYSTPYPHLHLAHPSELECITVRDSRRIDTEIVVSTSTEKAPNKHITTSMLNTSATGALLQCKEELGLLDDILSISIELEIATIKKYLRLKAIIRNISSCEENTEQGDNLNKYGVQFLDMTDEQVLVINAYVYEQIVIHMKDN